MDSIISPVSFLRQRAALAQRTEEATKAAEEARKAEDHQKLVLGVMKEITATAKRLANADEPFIGGDLIPCVQTDGETSLGEQACWEIHRGIGLVVLSAVEAHIGAWSIVHGGYVIMTSEKFNDLQDYELKRMLENLEAIAPENANPQKKRTSPALTQGGGSMEEEEQ